MPKSPSPVSYRSHRRWSVVEARAALSALAASGLSPTAFAAREGLDVQRLRSWRKKVGALTTPAFVEVRPAANERTVEIVLPSGLVLRVAESIDAGALRRWIGALEFPSSC